MQQNYTTEDLILYAYNETEFGDSVRVQHAIDSDPLIENEYEKIVETINSLDMIMLEPDKKVMRNLIEFISG
ncbi:MAG: hypothetical protein JJE25_08795 [Bacteroidia bacterium]|nr:hypothetical protein [Bacteroidia bacterium]